MHVPLRPWHHLTRSSTGGDQGERDKKRDKKRDNFLRFVYVHPSDDDCCEEQLLWRIALTAIILVALSLCNRRMMKSVRYCPRA